MTQQRPKPSTAHRQAQEFLGFADCACRILGVLLSLFSALGTAIYQADQRCKSERQLAAWQVYFKKTFGDSMRPEEVSQPEATEADDVYAVSA